MFPRIYTDPPIACPLDGYAGYTFRVLLNPTGAEKRDWWLGGLGRRDCPDCAALNQLPPIDPANPNEERAFSGRRYCAECAEKRDRWGRAWPAIYGTSRVAGFDFASAEAALASIENDQVPDELLVWLIQLPDALWSARADEVKKKLLPPSTTGDSTPI